MRSMKGAPDDDGEPEWSIQQARAVIATTDVAAKRSEDSGSGMTTLRRPCLTGMSEPSSTA